MQGVDGLLGDEDAGVPGGAQRVDLADGDGEVGVVASGLVAPAALAVLGVDDEPDGLFELFADLGASGHAVGFGQEERAEPVTVHRHVVARCGGSHQARAAGVVEDVLEGSVNGLAVGAAAWAGAGGHHRQRGQAGDRDVAAIRARAVRTVGVLTPGEPGEAGLDRFLGFGCDLVGRAGGDFAGAGLGKP